MDRLALFQPLDFAGLGVLLVSWLSISWLIEAPFGRRSVSTLMAEYRREWMRTMVYREPRIFDAQVLATLREGTAFFASASMIAIGGLFALIGNAEVVAGLGNDLTLGDDPEIVWELKLAVVMLLMINAFLKFVWSNRLFGYCAVLVAAVPNDPKDPRVVPRSERAAEINITAARSFNRGLRSIYFAIATTAWLIGPVTLGIATIFTVAVLWRREFASQSRAALIAGLQNGPET